MSTDNDKNEVKLVQATVLVDERVKQELQEQAKQQRRAFGSHAGMLLRDAVGMNPSTEHAA